MQSHRIACGAALATAILTPLRAASAPRDQQAIPSSLQGVKTLVTLGDSITEFGGQPGGYVWLLQRYLNALYPAQSIQVVNAGISGHKATDMQARFQRDVIAHKPDLVTISVGVNDVWHGFRDFQAGIDHPKGDLPAGVPLPIYRQKLEEMVRAAQEVGARVALLAPTPIYERLDSPENARLAIYIRAMREIAGAHNCLFIDLNAPFHEILRAYQKHAGRETLLLTTDGVHMNAAGNRVMACTVLRGLGVPSGAITDLRVGP